MNTVIIEVDNELKIQDVSINGIDKTHVILVSEKLKSEKTVNPEIPSVFKQKLQEVKQPSEVVNEIPMEYCCFNGQELTEIRLKKYKADPNDPCKSILEKKYTLEEIVQQFKDVLKDINVFMDNEEFNALQVSDSLFVNKYEFNLKQTFDGYLMSVPCNSGDGCSVDLFIYDKNKQTMNFLCCAKYYISAKQVWDIGFQVSLAIERGCFILFLLK